MSMKMQEREGVVITAVVTVLLLAWLGFFVHRSPRFAGGGIGAAFGITAAIVMLAPLAYTIAKRIPSLGERITKHVSMKTLMNVHVYAGLLATALAIIHTGHKFVSWLGIALTAVLLLVVLSGYAVRFLLTHCIQEIADKLVLLQTARGDLDHAWGVLERSRAETRLLPQAPVEAASPASLGLPARPGGPAGEVTRIAEAVADLEYSVRMHEFLKRWFRRAVTLHIWLSIGLYVLLALHIGAGIQYGLRWL